MASMGSMILRSKIEADHLTCSICFNNFTRPKALPCLHTFCEHCLREYVESRGFEYAGYFPCPMCRKDTQMPPTGVEGFPDNHIVLSLSDTMDTSRQQRPPVPPRPTIPPRPQFNNNNNYYTGGITAGTQVGVGPVTNLTPGSTATNLYPQLPRLEDMPKPEMPFPRAIACATGLLNRFGRYGPSLDSFHKPVGLAIGRHEEIVVSDLGGFRIMIFNSNGDLKKKFGCECGIKDVSVTSQNTILVTVKSKSAIMRQYSMEGRLMGEYGSHYRYEEPYGITALSNGHVAVTGLQTQCVYLFTEQFKYSDKFGRKGSGDAHFLTPYYIARNTKNNIIVSDAENHCIQVFNSIGKFKLRFGVKGGNHGQLHSPRGVCSDSENNIIVADSGNHRVEMFNSKGKHIACIVKNTYEIGPEVKPVHVGVTERNNIIVLLTGPQFAEVRMYSSSSSTMCSTFYGN